jgi:hypothetical protein
MRRISISAMTWLLEPLEFPRRLRLDSVQDISAVELSRRPDPRLRSCAHVLGSAVTADREAMRARSRLFPHRR